MMPDRTLLERLEDPKPDDVGAWVRNRVTGAVGQVWSYGESRKYRIIADGEEYHHCLAVHLVPIERRTPASVAPEPEAEGLW